MKTFIFGVEEVHRQQTMVQAETLEEAIRLINDGEGEAIGEPEFACSFKDTDESDLVEIVGEKNISE